MTDTLSFFATTGKGLEPILADELSYLNLKNIKPGRGGVAFGDNLRDGYTACLWSRVASRILLLVSTFDSHDHTELYQGVSSIDWLQHMDVTQSLTIDFSSPDKTFSHSQFAAQRVKDAIVDQFRKEVGKRPTVDRSDPDLRINVYVYRSKARVALDLSGDALHKRGYRKNNVKAPIKETLAAALLYKNHWPKLAAEGKSLLDPMCGSGTFCIEAALLAANIAPGLKRKSYGFLKWKKHDKSLWEYLLKDAEMKINLDTLPSIHGSDHDSIAIAAAKENIKNAGLEGKIILQQLQLDQLSNHSDTHGLIITNPPYGERLSEEQAVIKLLTEFGTILKKEFVGWTAAIITANKESGFAIGIRSKKPFNFYNGAIPCCLIRMAINQESFMQSKTERLACQRLSESAQAFANRVKKNFKVISKWAKQQSVDCYRLYDADIPEYSFAIDLFIDTEYQQWVHVQEYQAPKIIDPIIAQKHREESRAVIVQTLNIDNDHIIYKVRKRQKGKNQYHSINNKQELITIHENESKFLLNLTDYIDTGIFPDHRIMRNTVRDLALNKNVLNLFAYTGSFTVKAAQGGANKTVTVDMSKTYIEWSKQNFMLNGFTPNKKHCFIQSDCIEWLKNETQNIKQRFHIIILDPPTFSNSKRMRANLDIQKDYINLIKQCGILLAKNGVLFFSSNYRKFKFDKTKLDKFDCHDISKATLPKDYQRKSGYRHTWEIRHKT